jgi:hypothetical protein
VRGRTIPLAELRPPGERRVELAFHFADGRRGSRHSLRLA